MKLLVISPIDQLPNPFTDWLRLSQTRLVQSGHGHSAIYQTDSPEQRIHQLHASLLSDMQKTWFQRIPGYPPHTGEEDTNDELAGIVELLERHDSWVVEDPLLALFLPLWSGQVPDADVLLHYSEPLECAIALKKKWRFPVSLGLALWEQYMLQAATALKDCNCLLLSARKLRLQPEAMLTPLAARLGANAPGEVFAEGFKNTAATGIPGHEHAEYAEFLRDSQKTIYRLLEDGDVEQIVDLELSLESADILDAYGQIRAGFDSLRRSRDEALEDARQVRAAGQPDAGFAVESRVADDSPGSSPEYCEVTVHIRGFEPVEFVTEPGSPALDMLQQAIQTGGQAADRMLHLDLQDEDVNALYFLASDLISIETSPERLAAA